LPVRALPEAAAAGVDLDMTIVGGFIFLAD
jgi:hypothetical protein